MVFKSTPGQRPFRTTFRATLGSDNTSEKDYGNTELWFDWVSSYGREPSPERGAQWVPGIRL